MIVLQEKHTTGLLWWKHTYYTYYRFDEDTLGMLPVSIYPPKTIRDLEKK